MSRYNLYMFRCSQKLTKGKMAEQTGVSRISYTNIENGSRFGSERFWKNLQRKFGVPDSEMYSLMKNEERTDQCEQTKEKS